MPDAIDDDLGLDPDDDYSDPLTELEEDPDLIAGMGLRPPPAPKGGDADAEGQGVPAEEGREEGPAGEDDEG